MAGKMWVITFRGNPITIKRIYEVEKLTSAASYPRLDERERTSYIACANATQARKTYLSYIGFTWKERDERIECEPF